jgi:general secretion pathway protein I
MLQSADLPEPIRGDREAPDSGMTPGRRSYPVRRPLGALPAGFTLIEVLIALTIAAVALIAALRATATLTQGAQDLRMRSYALWSAENRLATIRMSSEWPEVGRRRFDCPQGGVALRCEEEVFATPNIFFRRVEVSVRSADAPVEADAPRLARLVGFATNVPGG